MRMQNDEENYILISPRCWRSAFTTVPFGRGPAWRFRGWSRCHGQDECTLYVELIYSDLRVRRYHDRARKQSSKVGGNNYDLSEQEMKKR